MGDLEWNTDSAGHEHHAHHDEGWCGGWCEEHEEGEKLSVEELQKGLSTLGESFTPNEVAALIVSLDTNDDGEFSEEELAKWIEMHSLSDHEHTGLFKLGLFGY